MPETASSSGGRKGSEQPPVGLGSEVESAIGTSSGPEVEGQKDVDLLDNKGSIY